VLIVRLDAAMYYANALTFRERVMDLVADRAAAPRAVVLDFAMQDALDLTSADVLKGLVKKLRDSGIVVALADVHAPVLAFARQTGLLALLGEDQVYSTIERAVDALEGSFDD
jgi:MFS superfamily sulfate permease-like transporter